MTRLLSILAIAMIVLVAACVPEPGSATPSPSVGASAPGSPPPGSSAGPSDASSPEPPATPSPTPAESAEPTASTSSLEPGEPSGATGSAAACSGTDGNRDFFANAASDLDWAVYCAVLPRGWFVGTGEYRLGNGGFLTITYEGPGNASFELREGALCAAQVDCEPEGADIGDASFGGRTGSLVDLGDGNLAVVVDRDAATSWVAIGTGVDESLFRDLAADLVEVSD